MLRMAGEVADGVHIHPLGEPGYLTRHALPNIAEGAAKADRSPSDIAVIVPVMTIVGDTDEERDSQRELVRAVALVGPFEAEFGEALDLVMLAKRTPVHGHHEAVDSAFAFVSLHGNSPVRHRHGCELRDIRTFVHLPDGIDQWRDVMAGIPA